MKARTRLLFLALTVVGLLAPARSLAQVTNVVFSEDFSGPLNTNKLVAGHISLEGGTGTIAPTVANGVVEFTGVVSQQWWAGGSLQTVQSFPVNAETNVAVSVDRVAEIGGGATLTDTANRSALWVMDPTLTYFVLFAEDVVETEWEYNRKIGITSSDSATGSGNAITAFDTAGSAFLDLGLHHMEALANGQTVKLYLDDTFGAEVAFPFSPVVFAIGSLARANNDIADTIFDNLMVETIGLEAFSPASVTLVSGQTVSNVVVRVPAGVNKTQAVQVRVTSDTPSVAIPVGAVNGTATLTFPSGGSNQQSLSIQSVGLGGALFSLTNDIGIASANQLNVVVLQPAGVRLTDDFSGSAVDATKWQIDTNGFENTGIGTYGVAQTGGQLVISGTTDQQQYWPGTALKTVNPYTATPALPLSFEVDRVSIDPTSGDGSTASTGARTGVYIITADRSKFVFFGQDLGESGWEVNVNPGNPTGTGTPITQFSSLNNTNSHHLQLVADGSQVEVFLDGTSGGKFDFPVSAGIYFEVGAYARALNDAVKGVFDNVKIQNILPPIAAAPDTIETTVGVNTNVVTITVPPLRTNAMTVTITSQNPAVAVPQGAVNGALTLQFPVSGTNVQAFNVTAVGAGTTSLSVTNNQALPVANGVNITVLSPPVVLLSDDFSANTIDMSKWVLDSTPLVDTGTLTPDSSVFTTNGVLEMLVICMDSDWPGYALLTKTSYVASATSPLDFEVDRTKMEYVLTGGNSTKELTGIWIKDSTTNYIFFGDFDTHDGIAGGWQYNQNIGAANDTPFPPSAAAGAVSPTPGVVIQALAGPALNDLGNHHMKVELDGTNAKLYVDGIFGVAAPFPFSTGITFGLGTYANFSNGLGNTTRGYFDNALVENHPPGAAQPGPLAITETAGNIVISWAGAGTLQSSLSLPGTWTDVSPAPTGNSYSIPVSSLKQQQYYRLRQSGGAVAPTCSTAVPDSVWVNSAMANQTGTFTAEWDATPSLVPIDSVMGLSSGAGTAFTSFACLARFYQGDSTTTPPTATRIDARNGGAYAFDNVIPYSANLTYHFRMVVNIPAHTYSTYVTPAGGTELTVGSNYAFRTEQNAVTNLDHWGVIVDTATATGSNTVCNFQIP